MSIRDNPIPCRHCGKFDRKVDLRGSLVMPTFLKDLSNFQIKLVWQNASVELMEADRVVFVGYSLPQADFEFRQLLSRMVREGVAIDVYLWRDAPTFGEEKERYEKFFSRHKVEVHGGGAVEFVNRTISG